MDNNKCKDFNICRNCGVPFVDYKTNLHRCCECNKHICEYCEYVGFDEEMGSVVYCARCFKKGKSEEQIEELRSRPNRSRVVEDENGVLRVEGIGGMRGVRREGSFYEDAMEGGE